MTMPREMALVDQFCRGFYRIVPLPGEGYYGVFSI